MMLASQYDACLFDIGKLLMLILTSVVLIFVSWQALVFFYLGWFVGVLLAYLAMKKEQMI